MKHLAILSFGASGTSAIVDQLFNNKFIFEHDNKEPLNARSTNKNSHLLDGAHWYQDHIKLGIEMAEKENKKYLIHIKPYHLTALNVSFEDAIQTLSEKFEFIFIKRNNYLAMECSSEAKKVHKRLHRRLKQNLPVAITKKLTLSTKNYIKSFENKDAANNKILSLIKKYNHICFNYENDFNKAIRECTDIVANHFNIFHDYSYEPKLNNYHSNKNQWSNIKIAKKIQNFPYIEQQLLGTKYEWMLKE